MIIYGNVKAKTAKAILFTVQDNDLPEAFQGKDIWFPLAATFGGATRHTESHRGEFATGNYKMTVSDSILRREATNLGCTITFPTEASKPVITAEEGAAIDDYFARRAAQKGGR